MLERSSTSRWVPHIDEKLSARRVRCAAPRALAGSASRANDRVSRIGAGLRLGDLAREIALSVCAVVASLRKSACGSEVGSPV